MGITSAHQHATLAPYSLQPSCCMLPLLSVVHVECAAVPQKLSCRCPAPMHLTASMAGHELQLDWSNPTFLNICPGSSTDLGLCIREGCSCNASTNHDEVPDLQFSGGGASDSSCAHQGSEMK